MFNYAAAVANVPQSEALSGQVKNSAGGFSFPVDDWTRLERFLVLGSEGNTYYATAAVLTRARTLSTISPAASFRTSTAVVPLLVISMHSANGYIGLTLLMPIYLFSLFF